MTLKTYTCLSNPTKDTKDTGVSENSVPLNPMVLLIIIPMKNGYFIGNMNPTFSGPNPYHSCSASKTIQLVGSAQVLGGSIDVQLHFAH